MNTSLNVLFTVFTMSLLAIGSRPQVSLGQDHVNRGYSSNRYENSEYRLHINEKTRKAYLEFDTTIDSPFGTMAGFAKGAGAIKVEKKEWGHLITMQLNGTTSYNGSTGSGKYEWNDKYEIESSKDGWILILPSQKIIRLSNIKDLPDGRSLLERSKRFRKRD